MRRLRMWKRETELDEKTLRFNYSAGECKVAVDKTVRNSYINIAFFLSDFSGWTEKKEEYSLNCYIHLPPYGVWGGHIDMGMDEEHISIPRGKYSTIRQYAKTKYLIDLPNPTDIQEIIEDAYARVCEGERFDRDFLNFLDAAKKSISDTKMIKIRG